MAIKRTPLRSPVGRSKLAAAIVLAAFLGGCAQAAPPRAEPSPITSPGRADDFTWYWDTVTALQDEPDSYSIEVRFTNMSERASVIPDCWAVAGPGHAGPMAWGGERPVVQPGDSSWASGIATFPRPIFEIDELVCDPEVAASYRRE